MAATALRKVGATEALAAIQTFVADVNEIFEEELSISFQLVSGTNTIFTNDATDGYDNGNTSQMLGANTAILNGILGSGGYDIGHVFGTKGSGGSGLAGLGVVGTASKGNGASVAFLLDLTMEEVTQGGLRERLVVVDLLHVVPPLPLRLHWVGLGQCVLGSQHAQHHNARAVVSSSLQHDLASYGHVACAQVRHERWLLSHAFDDVSDERVTNERVELMQTRKAVGDLVLEERLQHQYLPSCVDSCRHAFFVERALPPVEQAHQILKFSLSMQKTAC